MRLHAGIFGLAQGTPAIGLYREEWGPKMPGTWEALNISNYVTPWEDINLKTLHSLTSSAVENYDSLSEEITENIDEHTTYMTRKLKTDIRRIVD
jgi:polysaccharide pyruvyl transferase WcaK-like protein